MRGYVATTDHDWFTFLRARQPLDEVNFWQPSAHGFNQPAGTPFFFRWIARQARPREQVRGAIIVGRRDDNLISSVASNERLSLWRYDDEFRVSRVAVA